MRKTTLLITIAITILMSCTQESIPKHYNTKIIDSLIRETNKESYLATEYNNIAKSISHDAVKLTKQYPGDININATAIGMLSISKTFNHLAEEHNNIAIKCNSKAQLLNDQDLKTIHNN